MTNEERIKQLEEDVDTLTMAIVRLQNFVVSELEAQKEKPLKYNKSLNDLSEFLNLR